MNRGVVRGGGRGKELEVVHDWGKGKEERRP